MPFPIDLPMLRRLLWRTGRRLYCEARRDLPDDDIARNGEAALQRRVAGLLAAEREPAVVFDIGANVGHWTLSFLDAWARAGEFDVRVHAFEPVPQTHASLLGNLAAHAARDRVTPVAMALSGTPGTGLIHTGVADAGTNSLHADVLRPDRASVAIRMTTADAYCAQHDIRTVHFAKCDTEGHDCEVIRGAATLLAQRRVWIMQFEYNHVWIAARHFLKDVFDLVAGLDYEVGKVTPQGVEMLDGWHPELERFFAANYVLVRSDLVPAIARRRLVRDAGNAWA